jgi:hypothetical protein
MNPTQQAQVPWSELGAFGSGTTDIDVNDDFQYCVTNLYITPSSDAGASYLALGLTDGTLLAVQEMPDAGITYAIATMIVLPVISVLRITFSGSTEAYAAISGFALQPASATLLAPPV